MSYNNYYNNRAVTVTELNTLIKGLLDSEPFLSDIFVKGEISNFKAHSSGHYYFSLKDESGVLRAVMFRSSAISLPFVPENGMKVIARGRVSSFVRDGQYQLYAESMEVDGIGNLYIAFEQLKEKLSREGLFSDDRKKPLPKIPSSVGVITSPTGAAVRDIINITGRRFPFAEIVLYPSLVQGPDAPRELCAGLSYFNETDSVDVIIIGRGGGSIEDLWAFNDEILARTIAASGIPVISAVGHETDFTICDFVADMRAPTPSAAAEIAVPDTEELKRKFNNIITRESVVINSKLNAYRSKIEPLEKSKALSSPTYMIDDKRMSVLNLSKNLETYCAHILSRKIDSLAKLTGKLDALNPLSVISRGYSAVFDKNEKLIKSVSEISIGDEVSFRMSDGTVVSEIKEIIG